MTYLTKQQRQRLSDAAKTRSSKALDEVIEQLKKETPGAFQSEALVGDQTLAHTIPGRRKND